MRFLGSSLILVLLSSAAIAGKSPEIFCNYFLNAKRYTGVSFQVLEEFASSPRYQLKGTQVQILDPGKTKKVPFEKGDILWIVGVNYPAGTAPDLQRGKIYENLELARSPGKVDQFEILAPLAEIPKVQSFKDWASLHDLTRSFISEGHDEDIAEYMGLKLEFDRHTSLKDGIPTPYAKLFPALARAIRRSPLPRRTGISYAIRVVTLPNGTIVGGEMSVEYETNRHEYSARFLFDWDAEKNELIVTQTPERFEAG
ncbi:MAG: hypothetical protein JNL01_13335 [Bdellovibrionales bacterium]|nr:hypothetical protein [Bdellovibrionales bacterium]